MLLGKTSWNDWKARPSWTEHIADGYEPNAVKVEQALNLMKQKNAAFLVFGGSWCPDTRFQLPTVEKLFRLANVGEERVTLYGVDNDLKDPDGMAQKYGIGWVPTLVAIEDRTEIGRIELNLFVADM